MKPVFLIALVCTAILCSCSTPNEAEQPNTASVVMLDQPVLLFQ